MNEISDVNLQMHLLEIEITNRCNLSCKHCYNRNETKIDMTLKEMIEYIKFANKHKVSTFVITGGEACLNVDLAKFLEYISENREELSGIKRIVLQSNGLIENYLNIILPNSVDLIHLSFDIDNNNVRKVETNKILKLSKLLKENEIDNYLFATIHKENINFIEEMAKIAFDNDSRIVFNLCSDNGNNKKMLLSNEEKRKVYDLIIGLQNKGLAINSRHPYLNCHLNKKTNEYEGIKGGCTAGIAGCSILSDGNVIPCPFLRVYAGNVKRDKLEDIWFNSEVFNALRDRTKFKRCGRCQHLSYCGGCRSSAYKKNKDLRDFDYNCLFNGEVEYES